MASISENEHRFEQGNGLTCKTHMRRRISEIKLRKYGIPETSVSCEPTFEDIREALNYQTFDTRDFQSDLDTLKAEWTQGAQGSLEEFGRLQRIYHARRIAYFIVHGWNDPITVDADGWITDGSHRIRAAIALGMDEIEIQIR